MPRNNAGAHTAQSTIRNTRKEAEQRCIGNLDAQAVAGAYVAVGRNDGLDTPVENFLHTLLIEYVWTDGALTPEYIQKQFDEFKIGFREAIQIAKRTTERYPELMTEKSDEN